MQKLLEEIKACRICADKLPHQPRPVLQAGISSGIVIIGQAPGSKVHQSGIPWNDASGNRLREWLGITNEQFYDPNLVCLLPMGFCYPGKGKSGDLPPREECAPQWHHQVLQELKNSKITLLIGQYSQQYYLGAVCKENLTQTVKNFEEYLPKHLPLPHPSPRNNIWLRKNPWFEKDLLPVLREKIKEVLRQPSA